MKNWISSYHCIVLEVYQDYSVTQIGTVQLKLIRIISHE